MPVESADDRLAYLADFGVQAIYMSNLGNDVSITGIFDKDFVALDVETGAPVASNMPQFETSDEQVPSDAARGDMLNIAGIYYKIVEIEPDGTGMTVFKLNRCDSRNQV